MEQAKLNKVSFDPIKKDSSFDLEHTALVLLLKQENLVFAATYNFLKTWSLKLAYAKHKNSLCRCCFHKQRVFKVNGNTKYLYSTFELDFFHQKA